MQRNRNENKGKPQNWNMKRKKSEGEPSSRIMNRGNGSNDDVIQCVRSCRYLD